MDVDMTGIDLECGLAVDAGDVGHLLGTLTGRVVSEGTEALCGELAKLMQNPDFASLFAVIESTGMAPDIIF